MDKIILSLDTELTYLENIFSKYVEVPENLIFIKNNRYPLETRVNLSKYIKLDMVSNIPYHPFMVIPTMIDVLKLYIYSNSTYSNLFISNPLCKSSKSFISTFNEDPEEIILAHVPGMSGEDVRACHSILLGIYQDKITNYIIQYPDNVFEFNTDTKHIILINLGDIRAFRYSECLDLKLKENL